MTKTLTVNCLILHEVVRLAQRRNMQLNSSLLKDLGKKLNVKMKRRMRVRFNFINAAIQC